MFKYPYLRSIRWRKHSGSIVKEHVFNVFWKMSQHRNRNHFFRFKVGTFPLNFSREKILKENEYKNNSNLYINDKGSPQFPATY